MVRYPILPFIFSTIIVAIAYIVMMCTVSDTNDVSDNHCLVVTDQFNTEIMLTIDSSNRTVIATTNETTTVLTLTQLSTHPQYDQIVRWYYGAHTEWVAP